MFDNVVKMFSEEQAEVEATAPATLPDAIRQIARGVSRPRPLREADKQLREVKDRLSAIHDEIRSLVGAKRDGNALQIERELLVLDREQRELKDQMPPLRVAVREHEATYAEAIREALTPMLSDIAASAYADVENLRNKLSAMEVINTELQMARCEGIYWPSFELELLSLRMQRLAGK